MVDYKRHSIPCAVRRFVMNRDGYACYYCKATGPDAKLCIDHVKPVVKGGSNDPENLVVACQYCNCAKNDRWNDLSDLPTAQSRVFTLLAENRQLRDEMSVLQNAVVQAKAESFSKFADQYNLLVSQNTELIEDNSRLTRALDVAHKQTALAICAWLALFSNQSFINRLQIAVRILRRWQ